MFILKVILGFIFGAFIIYLLARLIAKAFYREKKEYIKDLSTLKQKESDSWQEED